MDKKTVTLTLTEKLRKIEDVKIVSNPAYQEKLIKDSIACYQTGESERVPYNFYSPLKKNLKKTKQKLDSFANYLFLDIVLPDTSEYSSVICSPFAIIGEEEVNTIKQNFYKDVNPDVIYAMDILDIKNFIKIYNHYINFSDDLFKDFKRAKGFFDTVFNISYDGDGEISPDSFESRFGESFSSFNDLFNKYGVEYLINTKDYRNSNPNHSYIHKNNLFKVAKQVKNNIVNDDNHIVEFFKFVFSLPYEEQNIESNKNFLSNYAGENLIVNKLFKEYSKGKYFCDYFDVLSENMQSIIVKSLKDVSRNPVLDSFLWKKGFEDVYLDHLNLYKSDADGFIKYFTSREFDEKKVILSDIMDYESINKEVVDWLNQNEQELVREVGLNG